VSPTALRPEEPGTRPLRIAVIGAGVAGLVAATVLGERHEVDVYEAEQRPGGHVRTVTVEDRDGVHAVDLGFIVYNERNYPAFTRLLRALGIASRDSDMSFAVSREEGRRE
jgi:predicted NAD/FAD-binding protein